MTSRSGNRSKQKKLVQTTLGKAPQSNESETIDLSHLRKPIDTSLFGLSQILSLFETATDEVRRYIAYECELMFECRICRTVFRSLANFILHKRNYCLDVYNPLNGDSKSDFENNNLTIANKEKAPSSADEREDTDIEGTPKKQPKRNLSVVLKRLSDKEECRKYTESIASEQLTEKSDIEGKREEDSLSKTISLESIENNKECVFQTINDRQPENNFMKSEVMEIHSILNSNEAILSQDGKAFAFKSHINDIAGQKLICTICNLKFATKKTLTHHIKYKHNDTCVVYICPECKDSFANAWCVFRHLHKVHRKSTAQIRRMRDHIHSSAIVKKQEPLKKRSEIENEYEFDSHPDDPQFCEACGKRFDRKAALHSHIQMCFKRNSPNIAKENQKNTLEEKFTKQKAVIVRGSGKRKQGIAQKLVRNITYGDEKNLEENNDGKVSENNKANDVHTEGKDEVITAANDVDYRKYLVQEIILGSRGDLLPNKKFIGLVSDEEEILGFIQETGDVLLNDDTINKLDDENNTGIENRLIPILEETEQKQDAADHHTNLECEENILDLMNTEVEIQESITYNSIDENPVKQVSSKTAEIEESNMVTDENLKDQMIRDHTQEDLDEFPKTSAPKQYSSKKCKNENKAKECDTPKADQNLNKDNSANSIYSSYDKITTPEEIDLPYDAQNDIMVVAEYDYSEVNDITYISDSDTCSCFDDRSNHSISSSESNKVIISVGSTPDIDESLIQYEENVLENIEEQYCKDGNHGVKRKYSIELEVENETIDESDETKKLLRERCEIYVDWSKLSCRSCLTIFPNDIELLEHMALHFNWFRYECTNCNFMSYIKRACENHICAEKPIDNCIVKLPLWKTINMATSFNKIADMDDPLQEVTSSDNITNETESSLTCDVDKIKTQDPSLRKMIMEVIFGSQETNTSEPPVSTISSRPIRNRISIRTIQKDFEFDMKEIDNKMKKPVSDNRVKPIKIAKNNDMNFHVINTKFDDLAKKKRTY